ncbi:hypothetical protein AB7X11_11140 [Providencia alcalifaciens]
MIKYLCVLSVLFSGFSFSAVNNNDMGLYRDKNYNVLALAGGYSCTVQSMPDDLTDTNKFNNVKIGTAKVEITPHSDNNSVIVNIVFDTGVNITSPRLNVGMKGSDATMYYDETKDLFFIYAIKEDIGVVVGVQNKKKGEEISVSLANCKYDKKQ